MGMTRREATRRLGALAVLALVAAGCGWTQFRSDPAHTGSMFETTLSPDNVTDLVPLWSVTVGDGQFEEQVGNPITVAGAVVARSERDVRAFDAVTGAPRWSVTVPGLGQGFNPTITDPSSSNGEVRIGYASPFTSGGVTGRVMRLDAGTGADLGSLPNASNAAVVTPVSETGEDTWYGFVVVFPMAGGRLVGVTGVLANGRTVLNVQSQATSSPIPSAPAVAGGVMYVGDPDGDLEAYDATGVQGCTTQGSFWTCTPLWSAHVGSVAGTPAVAGDTVYAVTGEGLFALPVAGAPGPGRPPLWRGAVAGGTAPAIEGTRVFVGGSGGLAAFPAAGCGSPDPCAPAWTGDTGGAAGAPTVANGVVYVTGGGELHAFAAAGCGSATCDPLWSAPVAGGPSSDPVVSRGRVYVGTATGQLIAFGLPA